MGFDSVSTAPVLALQLVCSGAGLLISPVYAKPVLAEAAWLLGCWALLSLMDAAWEGAAWVTGAAASHLVCFSSQRCLFLANPVRAC